MTILEDYRVSLDSFQGPLDLLLHLVRRAEVDVHDIPVAQIADQYLAFLRDVDEIDVEIAGEFLVMAATLIEIKSRTLAPEPEGEEGGEDRGGDGGSSIDPRDDLIRALLAYQRVRVAAERLDERREEFAHRAALRPGRPDVDHAEEEFALELEDVHALDLAEAYERIIASIDLSRLGDHVVEMDDTPIKLHEEDLLDRLQRSHGGRLTLQSAFEGRAGGQRIGLFLATLELVRQRRVIVRQDEIDAEIELILREDDGDILHIEADGLD